MASFASGRQAFCFFVDNGSSMLLASLRVQNTPNRSRLDAIFLGENEARNFPTILYEASFLCFFIWNHSQLDEICLLLHWRGILQLFFI